MLEHYLLQDVHARVVPVHHVYVCQRLSGLIVDLETLRDERSVESSKTGGRGGWNEVLTLRNRDEKFKQARWNVNLYYICLYPS